MTKAGSRDSEPVQKLACQGLCPSYSGYMIEAFEHDDDWWLDDVNDDDDDDDDEDDDDEDDVDHWASDKNEKSQNNENISKEKKIVIKPITRSVFYRKP